MKFEIGDKVRIELPFGAVRFGTIKLIENANAYVVNYDGADRLVGVRYIFPVVQVKLKPAKNIPPIPTNCEVMQAAIEHYGIHYQMVKATEELSELAKEVCKYQIGKGDKDHITEEMADVAIIFRELKIMLDISNEDLFEWADKKFHRLWEEINNEKGKA